MSAGASDDVVVEVDGGDRLTRGAWEARSNAVARGLAARGVGAGDTVGLLFDGRRWGDFAIAHLGVAKAGAVPACLSCGDSAAGLGRALAHAGARGLLCPPELVPTGLTAWAAHPDEVAAGHDAAAVAGPPTPAAGLVYPPSWLGPPRPWAETPGSGADADGWLVHTWAPGSLGGQYALELVRRGPGRGASSLARFDPDRLCALVVRRRAASVGLTPALAAALAASGTPARHDVSSVTQVLVSGRVSPPVDAGLRAAFGGSAVVDVLGGGRAAAVCGLAPVAVSQEGMLWHELFAPGSFNLPCLVRRHQGPLDVAALEWALSELVRRHEPLRSTFVVADGRALQAVAPHRPARLATIDPGPDQDAEIAALLADATGRPFDLVTGPLFEPCLVRLGPDDHLLVVRLHHTVFDDWSVDVLRRELSALYAAGLTGAPSPLLEPKTGFADVCRRQRARLAGERGAELRSWWRRELKGAPLAVQLPIGGDGDPSAGEPVRLDLTPELAAGLRSLAPRLRATVFMTAFAAFSVVAARATGLDDLVIATVVAHRDDTDAEPLIGCFTKKVPVRLRLDDDPTFAELVVRVRAALLGSLAHADLAFDAAVQEGLGEPAADHGVVPLVNVVFQAETPQVVRLALPGLATSRYDVPAASRRERHFSAGPAGTPWGDGIYLGTFLILSLSDTAGGMALIARGVFSRRAADQLLDELRSVLAEVALDPSRPISALGAVPTGARAAVDDDVVELRGFRTRRSRLERSLATCPGVADVAVAVRSDGDGGPRLVAYVVADRHPPPTLRQLRHALWARLPGALWPADVVVVDELVRGPDGRLDATALPAVGGGAAEPDPVATVLAAMWGEIDRDCAGPGRDYWQDFSFLQVLAEAREAGIDVADEQVVRCRTPETLAAALAAAPRDPQA